ncbi:hypothetical protein KDA_49970 [Dictyobacter alpinus]|uniref:Uncharacterized protein n=1 Tax=Dictyobacter alpinus TaxID=2014873 RepID=A0A402BDN3_9CHLR|nr:hypothetical protein [Dictyobacter alpinus]GCE29513.1 hypothetical protein KDA_49970 [Dictyobacter alpinus]
MRDEKSIDEGKVGVYICHPILRALLQERLRNQSATRYQELQRKTIHLLQQEIRLSTCQAQSHLAGGIGAAKVGNADAAVAV